jgi:predicted HicB family RNase H-like nuclease
MSEKKTMILTIRVEEVLHKALKIMADEDERKLSAYAARVLRAHARSAGKLVEAKKKPEGKRQ